MPIIALVVAVLAARQSGDTALASRLSRAADTAFTLNDAGGLRRANALYHRALSEYEKSHLLGQQNRTLNNLGRVAAHLGRADSAMMFYRRAVDLAHAIDDSTNEAIFLNNIGSALVDAGSVDSALYCYRRALPLVPPRSAKYAALVWYSIGRVFGNRGTLDSAKRYFHWADSTATLAADTSRIDLTAYAVLAAYGDANMPDTVLDRAPGLLEVLRARKDTSVENFLVNVIGLAHRARRDLSAAVSSFQSAVALARRRHSYSDEAVYLQNLAVTFADYEHRPDSASAYYRAALQARRRAGDITAEARTLSYLADLYRDIPQYDSTIAILERAIGLEHQSGYHLAEGKTRAGLGDALDDVGREAEAQVEYQTALKLARLAKDEKAEAQALNGLGLLFANYYDMPDSAALYYKRAVSVGRAGDAPLFVSRALSNLGDLHQAANQRDSARLDYIEALENARRSGLVLTQRYYELGDLYTDMGRTDSARVLLDAGLASARAAKNPADEAQALQFLGRWYQYGAKPAQPEIAGAYYDSSLILTNRAGKVFHRDAERVRFADQSFAIYDDWVLAAVYARGSGAVARDEALRGLAVSERSRSQALIQLMSGRNRSGEARPSSSNDLLAEGVRLVGATWHRGTTVLAYHSTGDSLVAWIVRGPDSVRAFVAPVGWDSLASLVDATRKGLGTDGARARGLTLEASGDDDSLPKNTRQRGLHVASGGVPLAPGLLRTLSDVLLPPELMAALPVSGELLIVPHGPLASLPFATLPINADSILGERYAIRYAPSLSMIAVAEARRPAGGRDVRAAGLSRSIVVANPSMPIVRDDDGKPVKLRSLPGAAAEGGWLAAKLHTKRLFVGAAATVDRLAGVIGDTVSIIHLATHGYAYATDERERDSFLAFAPTTGDDGLLTVGKVLDKLPALHSELVVLSACQTGLGNLAFAEGTVGLQRAFLARGAQTVLVSLWSVSDKSTDLLMRRFYSHWLDDRDAPPKSEALRRAEADVRGTKGFEDPRFWAAFQLVGMP